jgi:hypothetical protein
LTEIPVEETALNDCAVIKRHLREKAILCAVIGMKLQYVIMEVRNKEVQMCKMMRLGGLCCVIRRGRLGRLGYSKINNLNLFLILRKGDSLLRNNSFITTLHDSPFSPRNSTLTHAVYVGHCLQTCFLPATYPTPEGLGYFSNLFPHYISPLLSHRTYSPMKMERTECSETLAFKLQTPGNNPKANIRNLNLTLILNKS